VFRKCRVPLALHSVRCTRDSCRHCPRHYFLCALIMLYAGLITCAPAAPTLGSNSASRRSDLMWCGGSSDPRPRA